MPMRRRIPVSAIVLLAAFVTAPVYAQNITDPDLFGKSLKVAKEATDEYGRYDNPTRFIHARTD